MSRRPLRGTSLSVSSVCIGTSPLGGMAHLYGYEVDTEVAEAAVIRVLESDLKFLDTSNGYSAGESERRIGRAIATYGGLSEDFVLATKADPLPGESRFSGGPEFRDAADFSGDRVRRSVDESLERLGVDSFPLFYLHDPEVFRFEDLTAPGGAVDAMVALQSEGVLGAIGVAGGDVAEMQRYIETDAFQVLLNHNLFTLVNQEADALIDAAVARGIGFVNAAPFGGGMLAQGPERQSRYRYAQAPQQLIDTVTALRDACDRADVPLAAAALQFSTRDQRIDCTVVGISRPERVDDIRAFLEIDIPSALWEELHSIAGITRSS